MAALRSAAYDVVSCQVREEFHPLPSPPEYSSTTRTDYHRGELLHMHVLADRETYFSGACVSIESQPSHLTQPVKMEYI